MISYWIAYYFSSIFVLMSSIIKISHSLWFFYSSNYLVLWMRLSDWDIWLLCYNNWFHLWPIINLMLIYKVVRIQSSINIKLLIWINLLNIRLHTNWVNIRFIVLSILVNTSLTIVSTFIQISNLLIIYIVSLTLILSSHIDLNMILALPWVICESTLLILWHSLNMIVLSYLTYHILLRVLVRKHWRLSKPIHTPHRCVGTNVSHLIYLP